MTQAELKEQLKQERFKKALDKLLHDAGYEDYETDDDLVGLYYFEGKSPQQVAELIIASLEEE